MMVEGHFVLVYNLDHILSTHEKLSEAVREAMQHSSGTARGTYQIFELGKPVKSGTMGDTIKWDS